MISQSPSTIILGWIAPEDNGMPILGYDIYWNGLDTLSVNYTKLVSVSQTTFNYTVLTVIAGNTYKFKLVAKNQVGSSPLSEQVVIKAAQKPDAPDMPTLVSQSPTSITISWLPPNDNYDDLLDYKVYWD